MNSSSSNSFITQVNPPPFFINPTVANRNQLISSNLINNSLNTYPNAFDTLHSIREQLAKQQANIHRAVKDIIEGKGDKINLLINRPIVIPPPWITEPHYTMDNIGIQQEQRQYLNPQHPFYNLIQAYNTFDSPIFKYYFPDKPLSPYTQLLLMCDVFINIKEQLQCQQESNGLLSINELAIKDSYWLINALKINSYSPEFKKALSQYNHDTGYTDNFRVYSQYITNLFTQYSKLLIIRVDLGYQQQQLTSYDAFRVDMDYFINLIPSNPAFKDLIGYIWKLEYGTDKGYHAHLLLCYDGAKRRSDYHIAKQIGELWQKDITLGRGIYFNCNTKEQKANYKNCYLGMVHRSEANKINWMIEYGVSYLLKTDEYLRFMKHDSRRILGRGVIKTKNKSS